MNDLIFEIGLILNDLPRSERAFAQAVIESPSALEGATLQKLAYDTGTSDATIIRFCKRLGFSGINDFKIAITEAGKTCQNVDGHFATLKKEEITEEAIIKSMVGRTLENIFVKQYAEIGEIALEVRNLCTKNFLKNISFNVRKGEIVGFAGLVGAGRSEVMRAVFGLDAISEGEILIDGKPVRINSPSDAIKHGLGLVPEDRKHDGLILGMSVMKNGSIVMLDKLSKHGLINDALEYETIESYVEKLSIKTPSMEKEVKDLSGGNQQKVVVAKWLANNPQILIVDEPTRGIDVAAKKEIHNLISNLAKSGVAIIMISSEMPEVLGMCDRIYVMHEGRIRSELCREEATQEKIMKVILQEDA